MNKPFGTYEIIEEVGRGNQGAVYRARDTALNRIVALKIVNSSESSDPQYVEALRKEAVIAASLNHPNIATVYEFKVENDTPYFSMEYVPNVLSNELANNTSLSVDRAVEIAINTCKALEYSHSKNIIHRDIKPQNILLTTEGTVKVTDFGIAQALSSSTKSIAVVTGTLSYMSPEQWKGEKSDGRADIYALGIVLYEMLTGTVPFQGSLTEMIGLHLNASVPAFPAALQIPTNVQAVVKKALQKDPSKRFSSAHEMEKALENALASNSMSNDATSSDNVSGISFRNNGVINGTVRIAQTIYGSYSSNKTAATAIQTIAMVTIAVVAIVAVVMGFSGGNNNGGNQQAQIVPPQPSQISPVSPVVLSTPTPNS